MLLWEKNIKLIYRICILSILCSLTAIFFSIYRIVPFTISEATYIGILVSLMGIIFTIFVGYQIYNIIDIKKELKDLDNHKKEFENSINKLTNYQIINEAYNLNNRGMLAISMNSYDSAIYLLLQALKIFLSSQLLVKHWTDIENLKANLEYCYSKVGSWKNTNNKRKFIKFQ